MEDMGEVILIEKQIERIKNQIIIQKKERAQQSPFSIYSALQSMTTFSYSNSTRNGLEYNINSTLYSHQRDECFIQFDEYSDTTTLINRLQYRSPSSHSQCPSFENMIYSCSDRVYQIKGEICLCSIFIEKRGNIFLNELSICSRCVSFKWCICSE